MNILIDRLPDAAVVNGKRYPIVTDYRAAVEFEVMVDAGETDVYRLVRPFYPRGVENIHDAFMAALWFYRCGEPIPENDNHGKKAKPYSFEFDADVIFADFWHYYNINLSAENIHWWTFRALLSNLPDESGYKQRIYYRTCETKGLPKKEVERINKIRNLISLKKDTNNKMTLEERNSQMIAYAQKRSHEATKGG